MKRMFLLVLFALLAIFIFFAGWLFTVLKRWLAERRSRRLTMLREQHLRLKRVVEGLLARANEVDQDILYLGASLNSSDNGRLAQACSSLVVLSESMSAIDQLLEQEDERQSREAILTSCRIAARISEDIAHVQRIATPLLRQRQA